MKKELLVISSFPERGLVHGKQTVGVASYTKNTLLGMIAAAKQENKELEITVLAEKLTGQEHEYQDEGIVVKRIWKRNNIPSWFTLWKQAISSPAKDVFIAFELAMFGGSLGLLFFLKLLLLLRLSGKKVTVIVHHVITDLEAVRGHINTKEGSLINTVGTLFLSLFYKLLVLFSRRVVVFDQVLKDSLQQKTNKIVVIPHGVETVNSTVTRESARKTLQIDSDEFLLVNFGYMAWYKGTDWLVDAINQLPEFIENKKIRLIIAGGANPNRLSFSFYRTYIETVQEIARQSNGRITITGYIPEDTIALYYQAADCLIYPYRTIFSASGPLSLAFSYAKPILISAFMESITQTEDFHTLLQQEQLNVEDLSFTFNTESLDRTIKRTILDKQYMQKLIRIEKALAQTRSFQKIGTMYLSLLER